jgi:hypothetical protein
MILLYGLSVLRIALTALLVRVLKEYIFYLTFKTRVKHKKIYSLTSCMNCVN